MTLRVLTVIGTRPEAIKLAPVVRRCIADDSVTAIVAVTGQHRSMLDQVLPAFGIVPEYDLDLMRPGQGLADLSARALSRLDPLVKSVSPDVVMVQGDTTTALCGGLVAFYNQVPVVHLEAGLRTGDRYSPFPEELNRRILAQVATLHLAPTTNNRAALIREGVPAADIVVTGNTVIDALLDTSASVAEIHDRRLSNLLSSMTAGQRLVLVTAHRRESWGAPMTAIASAIARLADADPTLIVVFPVHKNPVVRDTVMPLLSTRSNIHLLEPLGYVDFVRCMARATLVLTDSGGVQEEAPSLGKPVLVMREVTERAEALEAGTAQLVETSEECIFTASWRLLTSATEYERMAHAVNPYGDGRAAERAVLALRHRFADGPPPLQFCG